MLSRRARALPLRRDDLQLTRASGLLQVLDECFEKREEEADAEAVAAEEEAAAKQLAFETQLREGMQGAGGGKSKKGGASGVAPAAVHVEAQEEARAGGVSDSYDE